MAQKISKERKARIMFLHETEGLSARILSERFGHTVNTISHILRGANHTKAKETNTMPKIDEAVPNPYWDGSIKHGHTY